MAATLLLYLIFPLQGTSPWPLTPPKPYASTSTAVPKNSRWWTWTVGEPGPGEIRIRHKAVGLNYIDVYQRSGVYPFAMPLQLGMEASGVVEAVGEGVTHLKAGDRAAYASQPPGSYCELRVMPAKCVCKLPDEISFETGAAMMLKGLTTQYLLRRTQPQGGLQAGDHVLFHAAAGGVGLIACQWARAMGLQLIGTAGSDEKCALALSQGAAFAINYAKEDFVARVKEITGGKGVKAVYDSVGKDTFLKSLDCLRPFGLLANFGNASGKTPPLDIGLLAAKGSAVCVQAHAVHPYRDPRDHAGDGRRTVRHGQQRQGQHPHRPALCPGRRGRSAPRAGSPQDHGLHHPDAVKGPSGKNLCKARGPRSTQAAVHALQRAAGEKHAHSETPGRPDRGLAGWPGRPRGARPKDEDYAPPSTARLAATWRAASRLGYAPTPDSAQAAAASPRAWALRQLDVGLCRQQAPSRASRRTRRHQRTAQRHRAQLPG